MFFQTKNNKQISIHKIMSGDFDKLLLYAHRLSDSTKNKFAPHVFDRKSLSDLFENNGSYIGYFALEQETGEMIAYSIIKLGLLDYDSARLQSYGLDLNELTDATFAPSVADNWQGFGVGHILFQFIISDLKKKNIKRIILWGGVQNTNTNAIDFYSKIGFKQLGEFEFNGLNYDMVLELS